MTRIFTDGAEMGDVLFFSGGIAVSATTTRFASGDYSYKIGYPFSSPWKNLPAAVDELYFKQRILRNAYSGSTFKWVSFRNALVEAASVMIDSLNRWIIVINGVTLKTSTMQVFLSEQWYCMEVYLKIAAGAAGRFILKIDDNIVCSFSGDTTFVLGPATVDNIYWYYSGSSGQFYIDDLALNDTAGPVDNSYCGAGRVIKLKPIGDGSVVNAWDGSDGNKVNNWELIDEIPKDDDVTYIYTDADTPGTLDQYIVEDYDGTDKVVDRIWAEVRARKTVAEAAALNIGFYTGSSLNVDDVGDLNEAYDLRLVGVEYLENPDDSDPWEESDLDLIELAVESG